MTSTTKPARERKKQPHAIAMEPSMWHRIDAAAVDRQVSASHVVRWAVSEWLDRNEQSRDGS